MTTTDRICEFLASKLPTILLDLPRGVDPCVRGEGSFTQSACFTT